MGSTQVIKTAMPIKVSWNLGMYVHKSQDFISKASFTLKQYKFRQHDF
jgi:hypothetical protein